MTANAHAVTQTEEVAVLTIERRFAASPDVVFDAWANPVNVARWMGPGKCQTTVDQQAFTVGGTYRWIMNEPDGQHIVSGKFLEIARPTRLAFTWAWEFEDWGGVETIVELDFLADGDGTRLVLVHSKLPSIEARDKHDEGWCGCLDKLENHVGT